LRDYVAKKIYRFNNLKRAIVTSGEDLFDNSYQLVKNPSFIEYFQLQKRFFNSYAWTLKSSFRLLRPKEETLERQESYLKSPSTRAILDSVQNLKPIPAEDASFDEIFFAIFNEIDYSNKIHTYQHSFSIPENVDDIMLISGVLNEIFSTAAFERGAKHLRKKFGIDYSVCKAPGLKSVEKNIDLIKDQVEERYLKTGKKVWVIAFSKGGLDFLHFMRKYPETANKCISGSRIY